MYQRHTHKRDSQNCVVTSFPFSIERRQEKELFLKTNGRIIYNFVKTWSYFIRNDRNLLTVALFVKQQKTQKNLFLKRGNLRNKKTWMNKKIVLFSLFSVSFEAFSVSMLDLSERWCFLVRVYYGLQVDDGLMTFAAS